MKRIIDVSIPIGPGMLTYPGDPTVSLDRTMDMEAGEIANLSLLSMSTHTGTHVDPPIHYVADGLTIDEVPLDVLVGDAVVVDVRGAGAIDARELSRSGISSGSRRVLFRTDWSERWAEAAPVFPDSYTAVTVDGAAWLIEHNVDLVGTDFISIEGDDDETFPVHRALLGSGIIVVEGLDLRGVEPGTYGFACLPMKLRRGDGGPARAILFAD